MKKVELRKMVSEKMLHEVDLDKGALPSEVKRYMEKLVSSMQDAKLTRVRKIKILFEIITALGLKPQELLKYVALIKKEI